MPCSREQPRWQGIARPGEGVGQSLKGAVSTYPRAPTRRDFIYRGSNLTMAGNSNSGRSPFKATDEDREKVRVLAAQRLTQTQIAATLDISVPTLKKHFSFELKHGAAKVIADVIMSRYQAAVAGNVSAQNRFLDTAMPGQSRRKGARRLGKKETALRDAQTAHIGTKWEQLLNLEH